MGAPCPGRCGLCGRPHCATSLGNAWCHAVDRFRHRITCLNRLVAKEVHGIGHFLRPGSLSVDSVRVACAVDGDDVHKLQQVRFRLIFSMMKSRFSEHSKSEFSARRELDKIPPGARRAFNGSGATTGSRRLRISVNWYRQRGHRTSRLRSSERIHVKWQASWDGSPRHRAVISLVRVGFAADAGGESRCLRGSACEALHRPTGQAAQALAGGLAA